MEDWLNALHENEDNMAHTEAHPQLLHALIDQNNAIAARA